MWFTKDYFSISESDGSLLFNNMRYGYVNRKGDVREYLFTYEISQKRGDQKGLVIKRKRNYKMDKTSFVKFIERILGDTRKRRS